MLAFSELTFEKFAAIARLCHEKQFKMGKPKAKKGIYFVPNLELDMIKKLMQEIHEREYKKETYQEDMYSV